MLVDEIQRTDKSVAVSRCRPQRGALSMANKCAREIAPGVFGSRPPGVTRQGYHCGYNAALRRRSKRIRARRDRPPEGFSGIERHLAEPSPAVRGWPLKYLFVTRDAALRRARAHPHASPDTILCGDVSDPTSPSPFRAPHALDEGGRRDRSWRPQPDAFRESEIGDLAPLCGNSTLARVLSREVSPTATTTRTATAGSSPRRRSRRPAGRIGGVRGPRFCSAPRSATRMPIPFGSST
jgi:hypothetical protein